MLHLLLEARTVAQDQKPLDRREGVCRPAGELLGNLSNGR